MLTNCIYWPCRVEGLFSPHPIINNMLWFLFPAPQLHSNWTLLDSLITGVVGWICCLAIAWGFVLWTAGQACPSALTASCPAAQAMSAAVASLWYLLSVVGLEHPLWPQEALKWQRQQENARGMFTSERTPADCWPILLVPPRLSSPRAQFPGMLLLLVCSKGTRLQKGTWASVVLGVFS